MNRFEKVSEEEYIKRSGCATCALEEYDTIQLPQRATKGSAGYDFYAPFAFSLSVGQSIKIPTGIKCQLDTDKVLKIYPRSSLGFKYMLQLANTTGIVDSDYYDNPNNEGHIFIKIKNCGLEGETLYVKQGDAFAQGIIEKYYTTDDDNATDTRVGGEGSTDKSRGV